MNNKKRNKNELNAALTEGAQDLHAGKNDGAIISGDNGSAHNIEGQFKQAEKSAVSLTDVKKRQEFRDLIHAANDYLELRGYTEHGLRHVGYVSHASAFILEQLGYDSRHVELAAIAGWIHDIGNAINRKNHGLTGATLAYNILSKMHMKSQEIVEIAGAIGNHEEETGIPVNAISAALIIADKSDAHRTRVRRGTYDPADIHDRVNYSIKKNFLDISREKKIIRLVNIMDASSAPMEYLEIYLSRILLSERAAAFLGCKFELVINNMVLNRHAFNERTANTLTNYDEKD